MLSVESALADVSGNASTRLRLGDQPGQVRVRAQVFGTQEAVLFGATAAAAPSESLGAVRQETANLTGSLIPRLTLSYIPARIRLGL